MEWLEEVYDLHKDWVNLTRSMGGGSDSEDIVQEMYLKLAKYASEEKVVKNGRVSKGYVYFTLKTCLATFKGVENVYVPLTTDVRLEEAYDPLFDEFREDVRQALTDNHWYYERLYELYTDLELPELSSYRKMEDVLDIHYTTLARDFKVIKDTLKNNEELKDKWKNL